MLLFSSVLWLLVTDWLATAVVYIQPLVILKHHLLLFQTLNSNLTKSYVLLFTLSEGLRYRCSFPTYVVCQRPASVWLLTLWYRTLTKWPVSVSILSPWLMSCKCHCCSGQVACESATHDVTQSHSLSPYHIQSAKIEHITHIQHMHHAVYAQWLTGSETF